MNPLLSGKECDVLCIQEKFPFVNEIRKIYLFIVWMYLLSTANLFQKICILIYSHACLI